MPYEVQTYIPGRGWINEWFYNEGDGVLQAETFETKEAAQAALDEFFADIAADVAAGFCPPCDRNYYRVFCVKAAISSTTTHRKGTDQ